MCVCLCTFAYMQKLEKFEVTDAFEVLLEKPEFSTFTPHCLVNALLPYRYYIGSGYRIVVEVWRGAHAVQLNTLKWLAAALQKFTKYGQVHMMGILHAENEFVLFQELKDSIHVAVRAFDVVTKTIADPTPSTTLFHDVLVPLVCGCSFNGDFSAMVLFLQDLHKNSGFLVVTRDHALTLLTKRAAMRYILHFERTDLGRNARTTVTRTLTRTNVGYGGAPVIVSFSLAMMYQAWAELKIELYTHLHIPTFEWR